MADREKGRALLCFAHYKEDATDAGRSRHGWIKLEDIMGALGDAELSVLDHYTSAEFTQERDRLRAEMGDVNDDE